MPPLSPRALKTLKTGLGLWIFGVALLVALVLLPSCRTDTPPPIKIGIGDGFGGGDVDVPGQAEKEYWPPSKMKNVWFTPQEDMARFSAWCYGTTVDVAQKQLEKMAAKLASKGRIGIPLRPEEKPAGDAGNGPKGGPAEPGMKGFHGVDVPGDVPPNQGREY